MKRISLLLGLEDAVVRAVKGDVALPLQVAKELLAPCELGVLSLEPVELKGLQLRPRSDGGELGLLGFEVLGGIEFSLGAAHAGGVLEEHGSKNQGSECK